MMAKKKTAKKKAKKTAKKKAALAGRPKQRRFAEEYLVDMNAAQAAVRAGYSKAQGARLMGMPAVRELVDKLIAERSERTRITTDRVLEELASICFSNVEHYERGEPDSPLRLKPGAPHDAMRAVSSVKKQILSSESSEDGTSRTLITVEYRLWDKPKALALAMRNLGMLNDKLTIDLDEELRKMISELADTYDSKLSRLAGRKQAK